MTAVQTPHRVARYRRSAAKLNYLALDNPCIAFASKDLSRKMSDPEPSDEKSIIRVLRYLKQSGMVECLYLQVAGQTKRDFSVH